MSCIDQWHTGIWLRVNGMPVFRCIFVLSAGNVLDLGCSPGAWIQVANKLTSGRIVGVDLQVRQLLSFISLNDECNSLERRVLN